MVHTQETSPSHNLLDNADVRVQRPVPQPLRECSLTRSSCRRRQRQAPHPHRRAQRSFTPESRHSLQPHSSSTSQGTEGGRAGGGEPGPAGAGVTPGPSLVQRGQPAAPGGEG